MLSVVHVVDWRASHDPERVALTDDLGERLTYEGLGDAVATSASRWAEAGVRPGEVVAVMAANSVAWVVEVLGLVRAGAVPASINWRLQPPEIAELFGVLVPVAVLADEPSAAIVDAAGFDGIRFRLAGGADGRWLPLASVGGPAPAYPVERLRPDAPLVLIHTSGTTGRPRVVPVPHQSVLAAAQFLRLVVPDAAEGARHLNFLPLFHMAGLANLVHSLYTGGEMRILGGFDPADLVDQLVAHRIQFTNMVPTALRAVLDEVARREPRPDLSALVEVAYGAAPMPPELLRAAVPELGCRFRQHYGSSETGPLPIASLPPEDHHPDGPHLASAGRLALGWEVRLVDIGGGEVATGEAGEVQVRGAAPLPGYWHDREATAAALTDDGFYRTGDIGRLDGDGYLTLVDRAKDMVISGGENVYPAEVEAVLRAHPAVDQVAVVGQPDDRWGEIVVAVVVAVDGHATSGDDLLAWAKERLAGFKCPRRVLFVPALPLNAAGKVLKRALRDELASGSFADSYERL